MEAGSEHFRHNRMDTTNGTAERTEERGAKVAEFTDGGYLSKLTLLSMTNVH